MKEAADPAGADPDIRRKRIRVRAWRRGMREMDILMGGFVDARVDSLDDAALDELEALLDLPDDEVYALAVAAPTRRRPNMTRRCCARSWTFTPRRADPLSALKSKGAQPLEARSRAHRQGRRSSSFANAPDGFDAFICADLARALARGAEGKPAVFVHVARDARRSAAFREALRFANPERRDSRHPGLGLPAL